MAEAKHAFVDDNPYLVYSPNAEMTSEGGSGFPVIEMNTQTGALSVTAGKLIEMLENSPVLTFRDNTWYQFVSYTEDIGTGSIAPTFFKAFAIGQNDTIMILKWSASSLNDYPTPYKG